MQTVNSIQNSLINAFIITGLSGAGKSTALHIFEDLEYFTVDGLPVSMAYEMITMMQHESMWHFKGIALGISLHNGSISEELNNVLQSLCSKKFNVQIIFLEAEEGELLRRYATTRRPHPLERQGYGLENALDAEKKKLVNLRNMADLVLNTTTFTIHDLRRNIQLAYGNYGGKHGSGQDTLRPMKVNIVSFGFKYGVPKEADIVFDVRFLPNPHFEEKLRPLTGMDSVVDNFVYANKLEQVFFSKLNDFLVFTLGLMEAEGRYRLTLAIGCTGGRHRSVSTVERIGKTILQAGYPVSIEHRHIALDSKK